MHILFIAPRFPLPADTGGKIRTVNILKQLAKQANVHLACFSFENQDEKLCLELRNRGIQVTLVPGREPGSAKKAMQVLLDPLPVSIAKYYSEDMETILRELNETNTFDVIHIDHLHMAHYQKCFDGVPCVIDEHNVEYKILERCADVEKSLIKKIVFQSQARKMRAFEKQQIQNSSTYLAVSKDDKKLLDDIGENPPTGCVIPNGVDTEYFKIQDTSHPSTSSGLLSKESRAESRGKTQEEDAVVFTGSMDWFPNNDAAVYFCRDILPFIWKENPNIKFYIVGKDPSAELKECARGESRIILTGRVDDVRTYVERSKIFVVPLRIGGGTRLKILEAMSMQKAVISTRIGAEGIAYTENKNIILADEPRAFADKVIALMDDTQTRIAIGRAGRALVLEKYDWNIIGNTLRNIYERVKE
jgi:sugar transferase (PEP-CTERM/EpsH1 system associated)